MGRPAVKVDHEILRELYFDKNMTQNEIAEILHISVKTIRKLLSEEKLKKESPCDNLSLEIIKRMYFDEKASVAQIAQEFNVSVYVIYDRLRLCEEYNPHIEITEDQLRCLYIDQNLSSCQIADMFGVSRPTINSWCRKYGIKKDQEALNCAKRKRTIQTCIDRYGVESPLQDPKAREKGRQTNLAKYGYECSMQNDEVKAKVAKTNLNKRGCACTFQDPTIQEKSRKTNIERYGGEYFLGTTAAKQKMYDKYGYGYASQKHLEQESIQITSSSENLCEFIRNNEITTVKQLADALGYGSARMCQILHDFGLYDLLDHHESSPEQEVRDFLSTLGVSSVRDRSILNGKEIDIYCPDYKIGVEFNGLYWHSNLYKDRDYHYKKSLKSAENGIHLIHIYEYEWTDDRVRPIIESILRLAFGKIQNRIYARKCEVREITNADARAFVNENHVQGHRNAKVTLGLFYQEELVQLMSFSHNKTYEWEIIRSCPKMNTMIVGGISKLFTYFVQKYAPNEVFSYADFNKFDGHGYESLGMKFIGYTGPDMKWLINNRVYNRNPSKHAEMKEMADAQIFGAGSKKFLWKK